MNRPNNADEWDGEQAIAHIMRALKCDRATAIAELVKAIRDGRLKPTYLSPEIRRAIYGDA